MSSGETLSHFVVGYTVYSGEFEVENLLKVLTILLERPAWSQDEYFPGFFTHIELEDFSEIYREIF